MGKEAALKKAKADAKHWLELSKKGSSPYILEQFINACNKIKKLQAKARGVQSKLF